jgi:hypothetical protein
VPTDLLLATVKTGSAAKPRMVRRAEEGTKKVFPALLRQPHQRLSEFCLGTVESCSAARALCILMLARDVMCIIMHFVFQAKKNGEGFFEPTAVEISFSDGLFARQKDQRIFGKIVHAARVSSRDDFIKKWEEDR